MSIARFYGTAKDRRVPIIVHQMMAHREMEQYPDLERAFGAVMAPLYEKDFKSHHHVDLLCTEHVCLDRLARTGCKHKGWERIGYEHWQDHAREWVDRTTRETQLITYEPYMISCESLQELQGLCAARNLRYEVFPQSPYFPGQCVRIQVTRKTEGR